MKILISTSSFGKNGRSFQLLNANGCVMILNPYCRTLLPAELIELAIDCEGIIAGTEPLTGEILKKLKSLKVISRVGVGMDNVDLETAKELGILVYNTPDGPTQAVAELTVALMLDLLRGISTGDAAIRDGRWEKKMGRLLGGKTIGLIGLGRIGRQVALLTKAFGCQVIGYDLCPDEGWAVEYGVSLISMESVLKEADIVSLHIPCEDKNRPLIGESELGLMKPGAYLINAARGGLVDEQALAAALQSGHLAGAALDTFAREPYDGPLKNLENVVLSPHVGSYAIEAREQMELKAVENMLVGLGFGVEKK